MKIGLISDTHGFLDERIRDYFKDCDEIWHAGDIGNVSLIETLEQWKPVRAVFGNIDDIEIQSRCPEDLHFECEGLNVWITHIAGSPPRYNSRIRQQLAIQVPDMLICGHSHILKIGRDPTQKNMLFVNPGAAGHQGFHSIRTIIRFSIEKASVANMEVIELGKRGALPQNL
jgi:uncharacterized protein